MLRKVDLNQALNNKLICRPVKGYEGCYSVTYNGMVYSHASNKFLKPGVTKSTGYKSVVLYFGNKSKTTTYVHRLVAETFIPKVDGKDIVNHITGFKLTNHVDLLEWCTSKENNDHAISSGLRKVKCTPDVVDRILSMHIKADKEFGAKGLSEIFNIDKSVIHDILNKHKYNKS